MIAASIAIAAPTPPGDAVDRAGRRIARHLGDAERGLDRVVTERLRVARQHALDAHRQATRLRWVGQPAAANGVWADGDDDDSRWGRRLGVLAIAALLLLSLWLLEGLAADRRAGELAAMDAAILLDDLPPAAYADPGFGQYLRRVETGTRP